MVKDSDSALKHDEWLQGDRWTVYNERLFAVGGFPFLHSLLILLYSKASYDYETGPILDTFCLSQLKFGVPGSNYNRTVGLPKSPMPEPAGYNIYSLHYTL